MTNNKYDAGHSPVICGIQSSGQYSFGATLSISCFFVSLTMRNVASVHDEIVRQRHNSRHCERLGNRHGTVHRGGAPALPKVDRSVSNRKGARSRRQNLRGRFIMYACVCVSK